MHMGGAALYLAAQMVLSKARAIAAHLLQADASEVSFGAGRFTVGGSEHGIGLLALADAARDPANLPDGMTPGLDADAYNHSDVFTFPNGCHAAEIEIDRETGEVTLEHYLAIDDYGRLINPMLTIGQVQGGVAQGIGQALLDTRFTKSNRASCSAARFWTMRCRVPTTCRCSTSPSPNCQRR